MKVKVKDYFQKFDEFSKSFVDDDMRLLVFFYVEDRVVSCWYTTLEILRSVKNIEKDEVIYSRLIDFRKSLSVMDTNPPVEKCLEIGLKVAV